ncbi:ABC transporter permease [Corynebacterium freiburgense]
MLISLGFSAVLRLGLGRQIFIATIRMTAQLLLVGLILSWVFSLSSLWAVIGIGLLMTILAAHAAASRSARTYTQILLDSFVSVFGSAYLLTGIALAGILQPDPWFNPQYSIPILGMVLGNALTGVSLAIDRYTSSLESQRDLIENNLALGATRWEATHAMFRDAMRAGMIPTLNSMTVMGIISLPGMMTGQILGGADPSTAVRYQILIMFIIAASTTIASVWILTLAFLRLFDNAHRLRIERLETRK